MSADDLQYSRKVSIGLVISFLSCRLVQERSLVDVHDLLSKQLHRVKYGIIFAYRSNSQGNPQILLGSL